MNVRIWSLGLIKRIIRSAISTSNQHGDSTPPQSDSIVAASTASGSAATLRGSGSFYSPPSVQSSSALVKVLSGHEAVITSIAVSAEYGYLFVASKETIRLWNIALSDSVPTTSASSTGKFKLITKFKVPGLEADDSPQMKKMATFATYLYVAVGPASIQVRAWPEASNCLN